MEQLLSYLDPGLLLGLAAGAAVLFGGPVLSKVKSLWSGGDGGDVDVADMLAAKRLAARFDRLKCAKGKAAVKTVLEHFFEDEGAHA